MLVFIDESGDAGFKLSKGSSEIFATAMVIFEDGEKAAQASHAIEKLKQSHKVHGEFKFSKTRFPIRDVFFQEILSLDFSVRALVVEKNKIFSPHLKSDKEQFYSFFIKTMMRFDNGVLEDAKIIIDGSGDRLFRQNLKKYLRTNLPPGAIKDVRLKNSKNDPLIQLADMCVGAIARSYRPTMIHSDRWKKMLDPKIQDIWDFR